jgi:DNA ligase (NAD+)
MKTENIDFEMMGRDELVQLLEHHNRLYWELNAPEISDTQYDEIVRALQKIDPDNPLLSKVHAPSVSGTGKVRHAAPMLSLDKAYSLAELLEWANKFARSKEERLFIEPKYDGISASFDGKILATRGDGEFGEDISDKLPLIELESPGYTGPLDRPARGGLLIR